MTLCVTKSRRRGFSLVELLVVVAIMVILMVIMTNRGSRSYQQQRMVVCERNLQTMYTALTLYAPEANSRLPYVTNATSSEQPLSLLVPRCTTVTEIFICPGSKDAMLPAGESFAKRRISYAYYMGMDKTAGPGWALITDRQVDTTQKQPGAQLFSPDGKGPGNNHDRFGGNVMSMDGSITCTKATATGGLLYPTNIVLLNPKP